MKRPIDFVRWFMPGLGVKRWLVVAVFGAVLFVNGASRWLTDEGAHVGVNEIVDWMVGDFFPPADLSYVFLIARASSWSRSASGAGSTRSSAPCARTAPSA